MPANNVVRSSGLIGPAGRPNANSIRVDSDTDVLTFGTGASGTTEKIAVDLSSTQTLTGVKTFPASTVLPTPVLTAAVEALAAAGSVQGDATASALTQFPAMIHGTGADATKGIKLPAAAAGRIVFVKNADAANAVLKVYPATGDAINAIAANTEIAMAAKTAAVFVAVDATTWFTFSLLPS